MEKLMGQNTEKFNVRCLADAIRCCFGRGQQCTGFASPLSIKGETGRVRICKVTGDRRICSRIAAMGVYPGIEADVICPGKGSRCVLKVNGGTISLDADVSENILVTSV